MKNKSFVMFTVICFQLFFSLSADALYISTDKSQFLPHENVTVRICDYPLYDRIEGCEGDWEECTVVTENLTTTLSLYSTTFPDFGSRALLSERTMNIQGCNETNLGILPPGLYILTADNTKYNDTGFFIVSDIGLMVKADSDDTLIMTFNLTDGSKTDANVSLYSVDEGYYYEFADMNVTLEANFSTSQGELMVDKNLSGIFLAESGGHETFAFLGDYYRWGRQKYQAYIYTDRTLYRPEQTIHYKAILWDRKDNGFVPLAEKEVNFTIYDAKGNKLIEDTPATDEYGVIYGDISLDEEAALGYYSMQVSYNGEYFYQNIEVQEYEKPEYYVTVSADKGVFLAGSTAEITVSANYYFGGPVKDADVTYYITRGPYWYNPGCDFGYRCLYMDYDYGVASAPAFTAGTQGAAMVDIAPEPEMVGEGTESVSAMVETPFVPFQYSSQTLASGTIKTDAQGMARINIDLSEVESSSMVYVNVLVMDRSRKTVESSTAFRVEKASLNIRLRPDKWVYGVGEEAKVKIEARDFEYNPLPGAEVSLALSFNGTIIDQAEKITGEGGIAYYVFETKEEGTYIVNATATDENGVEVNAISYLYVNSFTPSSYNSLEVKFDKGYYESGETAKAYVYVPVDTPLYWFTESSGIIAHGMIQPEGDIAELEIDTGTLPSRVYLSVFQIENGTLYSTQSSFDVIDAEKFINASISFDSGEYEPGEEAKVTVRLTDSEGNPVQSQLSFALVDKSVLDISNIELESIEKHLYSSYVYNQVSTIFSWTYMSYYPMPYYARGGIMEEDVVPLAAGQTFDAALDSAVKGHNGAGGEGVTPSVRSYFPDTAYWKGFVETDESGTATFSIQMPDSLTTWKAIVISSDKEGRVGSGEKEIIVSKDVLIRLEAPLFMTQRDSFIVSGVVHNYLNTSVDAYVYLETKGGVELKNKNASIITLGSQGIDRVDWEIEATDCCSATLTAYVITSVESDAMELSIPVLPYGSESYEHYSGEVSDEETIRIEKKGDIANSSELRLFLTPSLISTALEGLEFLVGYPYGCVEQTMSSFLPDIIVYDTLKTFELTNEKLEEELPDMVSKGLQRLYNFQHSDGGWGWWMDDENNAGMTAYVVLGLVWAEKAGFDVDDSVIERGIKYLEDNMDGITDNTSRIASIYTLSEAGIPYTGEIESGLTIHQKSMLALALYNSDRIPEAEALGSDILDAAQCESDLCHWEGTGWHYRWEDNPVETTSLAVKALLRTHPSDERISKAIRWLVANRRGRAWRSTRDSALALMTITDYARYSQELEGTYSALIYLNGDMVSEYAVNRDNMFSLVMQEELYPLLSEGENEIRIVKNGTGKLYYSILYEYWTTADDIPASSSRGITLTREYNASKVRSGQQVTVNLTLSSESQYQYLVLEEPIPAGAVVVDGSVRMQGTWARYEIRDEKIAFFVNNLWNNEMKVSYKLRARFPGEYRVLPAKVSLMYYPDVRAISSSNRLTVYENAKISGSYINITEANVSITIEFTKDVDEDVPGILTVRVTDSKGESVSETRDLVVVRSGAQEVSLAPPSEDEEYTVEYTFTQGETTYSAEKVVSAGGALLENYSVTREDCCELGAGPSDFGLAMAIMVISAGIVLLFTLRMTRTGSA